MKILQLIGSLFFGIIMFTVSCKKERLVPDSKNIKAPIDCVDEPVINSTNILKKQGQNYIATGTMSIWNTDDSIYILIETITSFDNSKLFLGDCNNMPNNVNSNNIDHNPALTSYSYVFPNTYSQGDEICAAIKISGNRIANISYTIMDICDCEIVAGDFRTQSKGGWGATPNGDNNGQYLYDNWEAIGSLSIGCNGQIMSFTNAEEVSVYLPNGNPASAPFNSNLATQTLALSISLAFDTYISEFSASDASLGCMVVNTDDPDLSLFNGMTVTDLIVLANDIIGGCSIDFSDDQMAAIIEAINLNFHDGNTNNGYLTCGNCN